MKRSLAITLALAALAALSGCGGPGGSGAVAPAPAAVDAFTQSVESIVVMASDSALPLDTTGIAADYADQAKPIAVY